MALFNKKQSMKPRLRRKRHFNPKSAEQLTKQLSAPLSKELKNQYELRNIPVRKNDIVQIKRGDYKMKEGKVIRVCRNEQRIQVEGCEREIENEEGEKKTELVKIHPSNVQILKIDMSFDRQKVLENLGAKF